MTPIVRGKKSSYERNHLTAELDTMGTRLGG
jgi:hypothetical protein